MEILLLIKLKLKNLGLTPSDILMSNGDGSYSNIQAPFYLGNQPSRGNSIKFPVNIFMEGERSWSILWMEN